MLQKWATSLNRSVAESTPTNAKCVDKLIPYTVLPGCTIVRVPMLVALVCISQSRRQCFASSMVACRESVICIDLLIYIH